MKTKDIKAEPRDVGSRQSRRLRREGRLPVNLYGHGLDPLPLSLESRAFDDAIRHHVRVFNLDVGGRKESAVIHDVQHDPLGDDILHIDFQRVNLSEKVEVSVPVKIFGPSAGELAGGLLQEIHDHIKLRCLPLSIPGEVTVDVRQLIIGQSFHLSDLVLEAGVEAVDDPSIVILSITEPRFAEEPASEDEADGTPESTPEVAKTD